MNKEYCAIDFETYYSKKLKYSLTNQLPTHYCAHPLFDPYLVSFADASGSWAGQPSEFDWSRIHGRQVLAHNAGFDSEVFAEMQRRGWVPAEVKPAGWLCTANMTAYLCNRRALADACWKLFQDRVDKSAREDAAELHWADFPEPQRKVMLEYAKQDAVRCLRLMTEHGDRWPQWERDLSRITIEQGRRGVAIDTELLDQYIVRLFEMRGETEKLIPWVRGAEDEDDSEEEIAKPTSSKAAMAECRRSGIPCPPLKKNIDAFEAWEATYAPKFAWIRALSSWRSINKLYKQMLLIKERLIYRDGCYIMPFSLLYCGTHTGRWSGSGKFNMQNPRKEPVFCNEFGLMETDELRIGQAMMEKEETGNWPTWVRAAIDVRRLIIARPNRKLIICDLAQIEPRVLSWLVGDWEKLKLVSSGMSVYEAHARRSMGWTGGVLKKEDKGKYALAKARELGLGYQCAWEKFITMAKTLAGLDITKNDPEWVEEEDPLTGETVRVSGYGSNSRAIVADFRANNPKIVDMWSRLDRGYKESAGGDFKITLPSGRKLVYEDVRADIRIAPNRKTKKPEKQIVYTALVGPKRKPFYGGKLTENATQAAARDVFGFHLVETDRRGIDCLFSAHDENVAEVPQDASPKEIVEIMSMTPPWLKGCPIAAEAVESHHYLK